MSADFHSKPPMNQLPEAAGEIARQATDVAEEAGAGKAMDRVHRFNLSHWRGRRDRRHPKSPGLVLTPELSRSTYTG